MIHRLLRADVLTLPEASQAEGVSFAPVSTITPPPLICLGCLVVPRSLRRSFGGSRARNRLGPMQFTLA
ncbi:hypothetical protein CGRA01v4_10999 [Colletotrichum graminicola]|nr:hypothetical protein CGRA01v4_10999 [Colletotrichum graminicola]